jgi:hypothetical protein
MSNVTKVVSPLSFLACHDFMWQVLNAVADGQQVVFKLALAHEDGGFWHAPSRFASIEEARAYAKRKGYDPSCPITTIRAYRRVGKVYRRLGAAVSLGKLRENFPAEVIDLLITG